MGNRVVDYRAVLPPTDAMSRVMENRAFGCVVAVGIDFDTNFGFTVEQTLRFVDVSVGVVFVFGELHGFALVFEAWRGGFDGMLQEIVIIQGE